VTPPPASTSSGASWSCSPRSAATLDEIDALTAAIARDGVTVPGSAGQTRTHPAINEVRQHRLALGRLLAQLALPDLDGASIPKPTSLRASHAARTRWGRRGDGAA